MNNLLILLLIIGGVVHLKAQDDEPEEKHFKMGKEKMSAIKIWLICDCYRETNSGQVGKIDELLKPIRQCYKDNDDGQGDFEAYVNLVNKYQERKTSDKGETKCLNKIAGYFLNTESRKKNMRNWIKKCIEPHVKKEDKIYKKCLAFALAGNVWGNEGGG